ncbi:MAG: amidase [Acidobacteriales bacterium]|nr:amidase [Terriglobales bacterium]
MSELHYLPAYRLAELVGSGELSSVEVVDAHLRRIAALNPRLNAFVQVAEQSAHAAAIAADHAQTRKISPGLLHGVPISIKGSIDVAGLRNEAGTKLRAGSIATADAVLVTRLKNAGAIVLGSTNSPELLMAWETDNAIYGRTNNPWDFSRTPGGSSGGESAAIAAGMSAGGVGSDGGGSIRVPAHSTGICGLKPTPGRIPASGHFPVSVGPFALLGVVGPMARTVADLKLLFEVMQGPDIGDPSAAPVPVRWPDRKSLKQITVGYFEDDGCVPVTAETRAAVQQGVAALKSAGMQVERCKIDGLEEARKLWWQFFGVAGSMLLGPMLRGRETELSDILKEFNTWVAADPPHTAESLLDCWIKRDQVRMKVFEQMQKYPVLLCPVAPIPAFGHGERAWEVDGVKVSYLEAWRYCAWFNLLGMPAASLPVGFSRERLPIGVQIAAQPWQEELVLSVAEMMERELGMFPSPPI